LNMIEKNRKLNVLLVITTIIMIMTSFSCFYNKEHPIKNYLYSDDLKVIYKKERLPHNLKTYLSIPAKEKNKIWENFFNFLQLKEEEKTVLLQNYLEFLKYDKDTKERLRKTYDEIFENM